MSRSLWYSGENSKLSSLLFQDRDEIWRYGLITERFEGLYKKYCDQTLGFRRFRHAATALMRSHHPSYQINGITIEETFEKIEEIFGFSLPWIQRGHSHSTETTHYANTLSMTRNLDSSTFQQFFQMSQFWYNLVIPSEKVLAAPILPIKMSAPPTGFPDNELVSLFLQDVELLKKSTLNIERALIPPAAVDLALPPTQTGQFHLVCSLEFI
jgi:hypothetical protein